MCVCSNGCVSVQVRMGHGCVWPHNEGPMRICNCAFTQSPLSKLQSHSDCVSRSVSGVTWWRFDLDPISYGYSVLKKIFCFLSFKKIPHFGVVYHGDSCASHQHFINTHKIFVEIKRLNKNLVVKTNKSNPISDSLLSDSHFQNCRAKVLSGAYKCS